MSLRDQIRECKDTEGLEKLHVAPWGCDVWLRVLTAREADKFQSSLIDAKSGKVNMLNTRAKFAVLVCCEENGTPLFNPGDAEWLGGKSAAALGAIWDAGQRLNKMDDAAVDAAAKNSEADPSDDSSSS